MKVKSSDFPPSDVHQVNEMCDAVERELRHLSTLIEDETTCLIAYFYLTSKLPFIISDVFSLHVEEILMFIRDMFSNDFYLELLQSIHDEREESVREGVEEV